MNNANAAKPTQCEVRSRRSPPPPEAHARAGDRSSSSEMGKRDNIAIVFSVILGDFLQIKEGDTVRGTGQLLSVPVGDAMIGRVVDPLGRPLDGQGVIESPHRRPLEVIAPGIADRQPVGVTNWLLS